MTDHVQVSLVDGIQTVRMNRPEKKNALTGAMYAAMAGALQEAASNEAIRCTLMLGVPGAYSAGNDIGDFIQAANADPHGLRPVADFLEALVVMPKPLVAGVDGVAVGVGTTMLMHCDYVVASASSRLMTPFVDLGLVPEAGSSLLGPRIMGHQKAYALLAMGEQFSAQDAHVAGLVNRVVDPEQLEDIAAAAASKIANQPPEALKLARNLLRGDRTEILNRMREESELFGQRLASDEARQAFMAFMQKGQKKAS